MVTSHPNPHSKHTYQSKLQPHLYSTYLINNIITVLIYNKAGNSSENVNFLMELKSRVRFTTNYSITLISIIPSARNNNCMCLPIVPLLVGIVIIK